MLKHISENETKTGEYTYWRTDDPNIIVRQFTSEDEIHIDKLNAKIAELEALPVEEFPIPEDASEVAIKILESENELIKNNKEKVLSLPILLDIKQIIEG